jgi:hypothetical protein
LMEESIRLIGVEGCSGWGRVHAIPIVIGATQQRLATWGLATGSGVHAKTQRSYVSLRGVGARDVGRGSRKDATQQSLAT